MKQMRQQGFAQNEPIIVLLIFAVLCLTLAIAVGAKFHWLWIWRMVAGVSLFGMLIGIFAFGVHVSAIQENRTIAQQKQPPSNEN
jgi:hypothetical protein